MKRQKTHHAYMPTESATKAYARAMSNAPVIFVSEPIHDATRLKRDPVSDEEYERIAAEVREWIAQGNTVIVMGNDTL
jgi:uncharacterized protein YecE (DUF72 family)